jgi:hypothetical protein
MRGLTLCVPGSAPFGSPFAKSTRFSQAGYAPRPNNFHGTGAVIRVKAFSSNALFSSAQFPGSGYRIKPSRS